MKYLYGILALVALIVVAAFVVPLLLNWESFKPEITERIEAMTGRKLWIDGEIAITILPSPKLTIADARLANLDGASANDMARVKSLDLNLALGPLLGGKIEITSLDLVDPVIELERLADGRRNWTFESGDRAGESDDGGSPASAERSDPEEERRSVRIDSIAIKNGTIIYRDTARQSVQHFQRIDAELSARSLDGPFRGTGTLDVRDIPVRFRLGTGAVSDDDVLPATLELDIGNELATVVLEGRVLGFRSQPAFAGNVRASGAELAALLDGLAIGRRDARVAALLSGEFSAKAAIEAAQTQITLDALQVRAGESQATGSLAWTDGSIPLIDAALTLNRLDLDRVVSAERASDGAAADAETAAPESGGAAADAGSGARPAGARPQPLPADIAASLSLTVGTVKYRDGVVRQAQLILSLDDGIVTVQQASALLPGGADLAVFGQLRPRDDAFDFDGQLDLVADDLRSLLAWLDLDLTNVPADRLRRFSGSAAIAADADGYRANNLDVRVDATRIIGTASYRPGARSRIDANLAVDSINADAYLHKPTASVTAAASGASAEGGESQTARTDARAADETSAFDPDALDARIGIAIGSLTYGGIRFLGMKADAALEQGDLTLNRFEVADAAGARVELAGTALGLSGRPTFNFTVAASARSLSGLIRAAEVDPAFRPETLGHVALSGSLAGDADAVNVDLKVETQSADAALIGIVADPMTAPNVNLGLRVRAPSAAELVRVVGLTPSPMIQRLGAIAIDGGIEGTLEAVTLNIGAEAAGATLQAAGALEGLSDAVRYRLALDLFHPRAEKFAETLTGTDAGGRDYGALRIRGEVAGDPVAAELSDLQAEIGPNRLTGTLRVGLDRPVPVVTADLRANELDLSLFGGAAAPSSEAGSTGDRGAAAGSAGSASTGGRAGGGGPDGDRQWSHEPLDLGALRSVDADLTVTADALIAGSYRFDQAFLDVAISDGVLTVNTLRGRIFDGAVEAEGDARSGARPELRVSFRLDDVDVGSALRQTGDVDAVTGRASVDGRFATGGVSEYDLIQALNGDARITSRGGTVEGVDLPAISSQLDDLDGIGSFALLAERGLSGGQTAIRSLDGTVRVENGIARTDDLRIVADSGEGDVRGTADLAAWTVDLTALFRLTEHPEAPPMGVRLGGSIAAPTRTYMTDDMQAYLVRRGLATAARKFDVELPRIRLREGASAEPGTPADTFLRELLGDPDEGKAPAARGGEPRLAPQQGEASRPPAQEPQRRQPGPRRQPEPQRENSDTEDLLKDVLRRLGD